MQIMSKALQTLLDRVFCAESLSNTKHCWAHGSHTVYLVIHGLTGTRIRLEPSLGVIGTSKTGMSIDNLRIKHET